MSDRAAIALLGAYVADAAALGLHWLYDPERISALEGPVIFRTPDSADFEGAKGYFAHGGKSPGALSHYGAQMQVAHKSLLATRCVLDLQDYQTRFVAAFGPGGAWNGYIDRPTRATLANLEADRTDPSGADDDQLPAAVKLPPLIAANASDAQIETAVRATNDNPVALAYCRAFGAALATAFSGASVSDALQAGIDSAEPEVAATLREGRDMTGAPTVEVAGKFGRACHLPQAGPVIWRIAAGAESYAQGIEENTRAGGDSCGRAPVLGALLAARFGLEGPAGLPLDWILKLADAEEIWSDCRRVGRARP